MVIMLECSEKLLEGEVIDILDSYEDDETNNGYEVLKVRGDIVKLKDGKKYIPCIKGNEVVGWEIRK